MWANNICLTPVPWYGDKKVEKYALFNDYVTVDDVQSSKQACKDINITNNFKFIANELVKILIIKKGGANTTNQIRIRIRPAPSSKQIKIREYEYKPSCCIREYGQPVANTNTSPCYVFIWLYLLYLCVTLASGHNLATGMLSIVFTSSKQAISLLLMHFYLDWSSLSTVPAVRNPVDYLDISYLIVIVQV